MRKPVATLALAALSLGAGVVCAEVFLRLLLAGDGALGAALRRPGIYADWENGDDYWKLEHRFAGGISSPRNLHPLLGRVGRFDRETLLHEDVGTLGGRRAVLLYGDSFAACVESLCFEEILNADEAFSRAHHLLNYGVLGYGLDQIYLLFEHSLALYRDPVVVLSLMTTDVDRTILRVRSAPKPWFEVEGGELVLRGVPLDPDPDRYFARHPPEIWLYSLRLLMHQRWFPGALRDVWMGERQMRERKQAISRRLIERMVERLRREGRRFVFLVFHPQAPPYGSLDGPDGWRERFLRETFDSLEVEALWAKALYRRDAERTGRPVWNYIHPGHGHPTSYFNGVVARALKAALLEPAGAPPPAARREPRSPAPPAQG